MGISSQRSPLGHGTVPDGCRRTWSRSVPRGERAHNPFGSFGFHRLGRAPYLRLAGRGESFTDWLGDWMRLSNLEQSISKHSRTLHLDSIRSRILLFAVLATLIPSVATAWLAYSHLQQSLTDKVTREVSGASKQSGHAVAQWLKDRVYDLRVFASSYVVTEYLEENGPPGPVDPRVRRLNEYLASVRERFGDYVELMVVDPRGRV